MAKLLILGSDFGVCDIIDTAHEMGLFVIVADYLEVTPAKEKADEAWLVSTTDTDKLAVLCRQVGVGGVMSGASDFNTAQVRVLCKRLGPEPLAANDTAWAMSRDKVLFKKICREVGAPVSADYRLTPDLLDEDIAAIDFPVVVKPADRSGNKGMSYCYGDDELRAAYRRACETSHTGSVVCEHLLSGGNWIANYILSDGEAALLYFARELHMPDACPNLYLFVNTTANRLGQFMDEVDGPLRRVFKRAGFTNGIAWAQMMLDEDGHFYLIDPAYRLSSETSYRFYRDVTGFDSLKWCIESAMGMPHVAAWPPESLSLGERSCVGAYHLFCPKGGVIGRIEGARKVAAMDGVSVDLPKGVGAKVEPGANMGLIRIHAKSVEEEMRRLKAINEIFRVHDVAGNHMFVRYTDYQAVVDDFNEGLTA
jgi:biotin carboxylase